MVPPLRLGKGLEGVGGLAFRFALVLPQGPTHMAQPGQPAPAAHASSTKSSAHKSPATRPCSSPGRLKLLLSLGTGASWGSLGALWGKPRRPWLCQVVRAPGPSSWGSWLLGLLTAALQAPFSNLALGFLVASPVPGWAVAHSPVWPGVAESRKMQGVQAGRGRDDRQAQPCLPIMFGGIPVQTA